MRSKIIEEINKLSIKDGDIVQIKFKRNKAETIRNAKEEIHKWMEKTRIKALFIITTKENEIDILLLDESEMKKYGWIRGEKNEEAH